MTILGPDGRQISGPSATPRAFDTEDGAVAVEYRGEKAQAKPEELLMAMARAERDGMNHRQLIAEFGLFGPATSPAVLNRALAKGHALLRQAIAAGLEPEETTRRHAIDLDIEPDTD